LLINDLSNLFVYNNIRGCAMNKALYPLLGGIIALGLVGAAPGAHATILTHNFGTEFSDSGGTLSGVVVVTLDDNNSAGTVNVTIDSSGLDASLSEKITGLYLNLNPDLDITSLNWSFPGDNTDPLASVQAATDDFQADGDGLYDILIRWSESEPGLFEADESDTITFALDGLLVSDFDFSSTAAGGHGPFQAVLRVISLGEDGSGSGWFSPTNGGFDPGDETLVPEPGSLALFGVGLAGLALGIRRRRKIS
jgi:hypothetical protein